MAKRTTRQERNERDPARERIDRSAWEIIADRDSGLEGFARIDNRWVGVEGFSSNRLFLTTGLPRKSRATWRVIRLGALWVNCESANVDRR